MARQYFNATLADSIIAAQSVTPTTTPTSIFTPWGVASPLSVPAGSFAGQVYRFACGGLITAATTGTLTITPYFGMGASAISFTGGVSFGASPAQTVPSTALSNSPWRMEGELIFRVISPAVSASTCWICGTLTAQGVLATQGTSLVVPFSSGATVDTTGTAAAAGIGGLNFVVTFSVTGATIITEYTSIQSLN